MARLGQILNYIYVNVYVHVDECDTYCIVQKAKKAEAYL